MKEMILQTRINVCSYDELSGADKAVVDAARAATANSYAVYSNFSVGAAVLLGNGTVVSGSNQENAAYPSGLCAERTTLFWANSQYPKEPVEVLAIAAKNVQGELEFPITPCGACRQVMAQYQLKSGLPMRVLLVGAHKIWRFEKVDDLLPLIFDSI